MPRLEYESRKLLFLSMILMVCLSKVRKISSRRAEVEYCVCHMATIGYGSDEWWGGQYLWLTGILFSLALLYQSDTIIYNNLLIL